MISVLAFVAISSALLQVPSVECIEDRILDYFSSANLYFANHPHTKHIFMIISGLMMDTMVLVSFYRFSFHGKSWRFPLAMFIFYMGRVFIQHIFLIKYPRGYLWEFPGIYSLSVPYSKTNDFFYSGHLGCAVICTLEFFYTGWKKMAVFSILTAIVQASLMTLLRGHYSIDLFAGIIFGHYFWMMSDKYSFYLDVKLFKMTLNTKDKS